VITSSVALILVAIIIEGEIFDIFLQNFVENEDKIFFVNIFLKEIVFQLQTNIPSLL
jgi:hypothetical protein